VNLCTSGGVDHRSGEYRGTPLCRKSAILALQAVGSRFYDERWSQGGHAVQELTIRRRFAAGLRNFSYPYRGLVDMWQHYDNASAPPALIAEGGNP
jgi:predicted ABC-type ATPase